MQPNVVVVGRSAEKLAIEQEIFASAGIHLNALPHPREGEPLPGELQEADGILFSGSWSVDGHVLRQLKRCRVIGRYGLGYDSIDVDKATAQGIAVVIARGYCEEEISEHVLALMLSWYRRIPFYDRQARGDSPIKIAIPIPRISTLTAGLCGFGGIARALAPKLQAMGMKVIAYDPFIPPDVFSSLEVRSVSFDELLAESDMISIHCALTEDTHHLFNETAFKTMKRNALLINTARGGIIDTASLANALRNNEIAGACLDVVEAGAVETLALHTIDSLLLTPHMAWDSSTARIELSRRAATNVRSVLEGKIPDGLVNPDVITSLNLVG